jgi:hypothetical protein
MEIKLNKMEDAPKDGTHIIVKTKDLEHLDMSFVEAWWWKPTELHQWESGARPCWQTLTNQGFFDVNNLIGWIPLPLEIVE